MKNKTKFIVMSIIIFIIIALVAFFMKSIFFESDMVDTKSQVQIHQYIMKESEGKIAIYKDDELIDTLDVYVQSLPEEDVKSLKEGILIEDEIQLESLIEAFDS